MKIVERKLAFLSLFLSPFLAFVITLGSLSFLLPKIFPVDPAKEKMARLVQDHFAGRSHGQISVFDDHVYMAKNAIEKGKIISKIDVQVGNFKLNSPHRGLILSDQQVIGSTANHTLKAGQLLNLSDLKRSQKPTNAIESESSEDSDNGAGLFIAGIFAFISIPFLAILISYIWIVRIAFKTSATDGFTCLFLSPFAIPSFVMRDWNGTRIPFLLNVVGCALLGVLGAMMISGKIDQQEVSLTTACKWGELEARREMKCPVIYTLKDIGAGQLISSDAVTTKEIQIDTIPQDAITKPSVAIGKKAKYGISPNQIISVHDLQ